MKHYNEVYYIMLKGRYSETYLKLLLIEDRDIREFLTIEATHNYINHVMRLGEKMSTKLKRLKEKLKELGFNWESAKLVWSEVKEEIQDYGMKIPLW